MKLDRDIKRRIVKMIMNLVDCNESFDVSTIIGNLIEEDGWDIRIDPADAYVYVRDIIETLIPIIEYKRNDTEEGIVYTPFPH